MRLFSTLIALLLALPMLAQTTPPTINEMAGDFVLINYKINTDYSPDPLVAEVRDFTLTPKAGTDSLIAGDFYIDGMPDFKVKFGSVSGNITIPGGTCVFSYSDGNGSVQYLYSFDEATQEVSPRPITYRYQGNGVWECTIPIVLMTGQLVNGELSGDLTPYYHSQGSRICRANATMTDLVYDGDAVAYNDVRPVLVLREDANSLTFYNLTQIDGYGNGSWLQFAYNRPTQELLAYGTIIDDASDIEYPYKALTGCEYDAETKRPTGPSKYTLNGEEYDGLISAKADPLTGIITFDPMCVWPASYDETNGVNINTEAFYEVYEWMKLEIKDFEAVTSISTPMVSGDASGRKVLSTEYYTPAGRRINAPAPGMVTIKKQTFSDGTVKAEKILK